VRGDSLSNEMRIERRKEEEELEKSANITINTTIGPVTTQNREILTYSDPNG